MQRAFPTAVGLDALDDLRAVLPEAVHLHQLFRRVLQIAVHHGDAVASRLPESGKDRGLLAEIPGKPRAAHVAAALRLGADALPCSVLRPVVYKYQLVRDLRRKQHAADLLCRRGDGLLLVIRRNHYG